MSAKFSRALWACALLSLLCCRAGYADEVAAGATPKPNIALELFTSQGCSSCPPADRLLAKLAQLPGVVALSRPVQYWDRLGWKDTLATAANTELQYAYAGRWREAGVYTPQLVIDGIEGIVGNQEATIRRRIDELYAHKSGVVIRSALRQQNTIAVTLTGDAAAPAAVHLLWLRADTSVAILRGENATRRIHYVNAVIAEKTIGHWQGHAATLMLDVRDLHRVHSDRWAIVVQERGPGRILGADYLNVPASARTEN